MSPACERRPEQPLEERRVVPLRLDGHHIDDEEQEHEVEAGQHDQPQDALPHLRPRWELPDAARLGPQEEDPREERGRVEHETHDDPVVAEPVEVGLDHEEDAA